MRAVEVASWLSALEVVAVATTASTVVNQNIIIFDSFYYVIYIVALVKLLADNL